MPKLDFTGTQEIEKRQVAINGYIETLPKKDDYKIPIKGLITIDEAGYSSHNFTGSVTQLVLGYPPEITLYTNNGLGMKLFYRLENPEVFKEKLIYPGIWCPITKETLPELAYPLGTQKISKNVSLEFILKTKEDILLL